MAAPSPELAGEAQPQSAIGGAKAILWRIAEKLGALLILIAILLVMTVFYPDFITTSNLLTIGLQATTRAILAIGVTLVDLDRGISPRETLVDPPGAHRVEEGPGRDERDVVGGADVVDRGRPG